MAQSKIGGPTASLDRRLFGALLLGCGAAAWLCPELARAEQKVERIKFRWRVPVAHSNTVKKSLSDNYVGKVTQEKNAKGLPLLLVIVGVAFVSDLAKSAIAVRRRIRNGGVTIDVRGPEAVISIDKSLDRGVIVIRTKNGPKIHERGELNDPSELTAMIADLR